MDQLSRIDFPYDIEVLCNVFTITFYNHKGKSLVFEISEFKNEFGPLKGFIEKMRRNGSRMIGFNNKGYDYPVLHYLLTELGDETDVNFLLSDLHEKSQSIIDTPFENRFSVIIPAYKEIVQQIDLLKIHHFDNKQKGTSLKMLEFNMRMDDIRDFPFDPNTPLTKKQILQLIAYNKHDVKATRLFAMHSVNAITFRESLTAKYGRDFLNHNDTKIGKDYFVMQLEKQMGKDICYYKVGGKRKIRQTKRKSVDLGEIVFDYVKFRTPAFKAIHKWLTSQVITKTKGVFSDLTLDEMSGFIEYSPIANIPKVRKWLDDCQEASLFQEPIPDPPRVAKKYRRASVLVDGVEFVFGTGGIHASVHNRRVESNDTHVLIDMDVTSYYPSLGITNRIYPEHLSERFCDIYQEVKDQRVRYKKGTPENKMLKLALNGVYGDSNSTFSPFYDPKYTMSITVNGQFCLCMLYESLREIDGLELIQVNTDGLTVLCPRDAMDELQLCKSEWEEMTGLNMEELIYDMMYIRDVNNYVAVHEGGEKIKRKGAYAFVRPDEEDPELDWHQNHSSLVIQKAACDYIINGTDVREFIENHEDEYDFLLRTKVPRTSRLVADWGYGLEEDLQNITRYYIAKHGPELVKVMPPLPKKPDVYRMIGINKGWSIKECNHFTGIDRDLINYDWYIQEAEKLINYEIEGED